MVRLWLIGVALLAVFSTLPAFGQAEPDVPRVRGEVRDVRQAIQKLQERADQTQAQIDQSLGGLDERLGATQQQIQSQTAAVASSVAELDSRLGYIEQTGESNRKHLDRFWLLMAALFVFFMQAGFLCLEVGMVRRQHTAATALKNVLDWLVLSVVFFLFGFAFMYGETLHGLIGTSLFAPTLTTMEAANPKFGIEFFLFQLAFAGTAATIVSGAMAERTALMPYMVIALFAGGLLYPLIGHWAWGVDFSADPENGVATGWLKQLGFLDFAGSTVVHCVGAWIALWGIRQVGPRAGRFNRDGSVNDKPFAPYNLGYSMLGVFILWFGWWGFNGGSQLRYDLSVSSIILNTNLSAAAGGLVAFMIASARDPNRSYVQLIGGTLGGLVAVTANCDRITPLEAILIGAVAGGLHYMAVHALLKLKLDDPVGAIPVHGACGVWGTLAVAVFGDNLPMARLPQFGVQILGITVVFVTVSLASYVFFALLDRFGIRVSLAEERDGFTIGRTPERPKAAVRNEAPANAAVTEQREANTIARTKVPREVYSGNAAGNTIPLVD
jgi:Amt family ammonium transporter